MLVFCDELGAHPDCTVLIGSSPPPALLPLPVEGEATWIFLLEYLFVEYDEQSSSVVHSFRHSPRWQSRRAHAPPPLVSVHTCGPASCFGHWRSAFDGHGYI